MTSNELTLATKFGGNIAKGGFYSVGWVVARQGLMA